MSMHTVPTRHMTRRVLTGATALACCAGLAACSFTGGTTNTGDSSESAVTTTALTTTTAGSTATTPTVDAQESSATMGSGASVDDKVVYPGATGGTISAIRIGSHDGFDRVVFELDAPGEPGWFAHYRTEVAAQGSGFPIEFTGDRSIELLINGLETPYEDPSREFSGEVTAAGTSAVTTVSYHGTFEGQAQAVIGLSGPERPFTVYTLSNPSRVVVDIQTS